MESGTTAADQQGKESTDFGSVSSVRDVTGSTGSIANSVVIESSECDSAPQVKVTPDGNTATEFAQVEEPHPKEERQKISKGVACGLSEIGVEEQNGPTDVSNVTTSTNMQKEAKYRTIVATGTRDDLKTPNDEELEQPVMDGNVDLELKFATSLEIEKLEAVSDDGSVDPVAKSPLESTNSVLDTEMPTQEETASVQSFDRITFPQLQSTKEVNDEIPSNNPVFFQRKRILGSNRTDPQRSSSFVLLSLPIDSLHSIASFLEPLEWKSFGQCNKATNKIGREIFRRVRMHGFRCATEVVTAWKFGQHADAKELCALYVSSGVPIYPHSLGHSYHTLVWRLSIEAKHLEELKNKQKDDSKNGLAAVKSIYPTDPSTVALGLVDEFYNDRDEFRRREDLIDGLGEADLTFLEEKSLFNQKTDESKKGIFTGSNHRRRSSIDQAHQRARNLPPGALPQAPQIPPPLRLGGSGGQVSRGSWGSNPGTGRGAAFRGAHARSHSFSGNCYRAPNLTLKIHRHLLDQHLLGRSAVNDVEGAMTTPTVSLSADFFHPFFTFRPSEDTTRHQKEGFQNSESTTAPPNNLLPAYNQHPVETMNDSNHDQVLTSRVEPRRPDLADDSDSDAETEMVFPTFVMEPRNSTNTNEQTPAMAHSSSSIDQRNPQRRQTFSGATLEMHSQVATHNGILSNVDLDVYSASFRNQKSDTTDTKERQLKKYLNARFTVYQCCLERHLLHNDSNGFEETILDFWDEFFPQTVNIHYYDFYTAVPRISRLEKFLTKPCPKQIGIVQCEIERVKLNSKKKGVNMKGRFFPTYEYRLFIRHRPDPTYDDSQNARRDTVLMTAKNRGRRYSENTAQASKKGSNNYFLSLPQQEDLDLHFKSANGLSNSMEHSPNGTGSHADSSEFSGLLGRLQSNFVGTEFQIFTPRSASEGTKSRFFSSSPLSTPNSISSRARSDDDVVFDNVRHRELNPISPDRPRSRFGRRSLRRRSGSNGESPLHFRRSRSNDATPGRNRKVSAAESFFESQHFKTEPERTFTEEEDGAITYTANLLGSRPRIMDVCIPKVNDNATATEWRRYLENCKDQDVVSSADRLLNHLKQLQQNGQTEDNGRHTNPANNDEENNIGGEEQGYSPPSDYGLLALQNRPPWWNVELGSFVLNFGGRVSVASVKNFQLCDRNEHDHIMLQFGRIEGRHSFTMDFQYPLTAVQAFAIAISSLQSKISFG